MSDAQAMLLAFDDEQAMAAELAGGRKAGDAYTQAARRVAEILRRALAQGRAAA